MTDYTEQRDDLADWIRKYSIDAQLWMPAPIIAELVCELLAAIGFAQEQTRNHITEMCRDALAPPRKGDDDARSR